LIYFFKKVKINQSINQSIQSINKMQIRVLVSSVNYPEVIAYYNSHKGKDDMPLTQLNRAEGGFQIQLKEYYQEDNENDKIKQLRWEKRRLVPKNGFPHFEEHETQLLYAALKHVLGADQVLLEGNYRGIKGNIT
jgi:hypothetical protein